MRFGLLAGVMILGVPACSPQPEPRFEYPPSNKQELVESLHGVEVADPYRWLEDLDSTETAEWVGAQNKVTFEYLNSLPERAAIRNRLEQLWNFERYEVPVKAGESYFYLKNDGLQNQSVLYVSSTLEGEARVLLDPNTLSEDGTIALTEFVPSPDGRLLAYGTSSGGSDWQVWRIRDVATGKDQAEKIEWVKFSRASWSADNKGFYYSRYDAPAEGGLLEEVNYFPKVYYHRAGTLQEKDRLVYERPDQKEWNFSARATKDGRYLILHIGQGTDERKRVYYRSLTPPGAVTPLLDDFDASYEFVGNQGHQFIFQTNRDAPRGRIVEIDIRKPGVAQWREIVAQSEDTLDQVELAGEKLVLTYLKDARHDVRLFDLKGTSLGSVELPGIGRVEDFEPAPDGLEAHYAFQNDTTPSTIYRLDLRDQTSTPVRQPQVNFDPHDFETRQVFYSSKDGTRVPMFVSHRKGLELNGQAPTILYGYGGFNISQIPRFRLIYLAWMELGGVFAVANLRGGGEYGKEWHEAGTKERKQNVFDDFEAAARWLIDNNYTQSSKLAVRGGSNGGLLVGALMTQHPELAAVALPAVGVMDMLRFHKFTIGWAWVSDYGSPDNPEEFKTLYAYSPYHNLREGVRYPSTLVTTADHDDRVVPSHSFKFAARLQEVHGGENPVLIRIETRAGHGRGKPVSKQIDEAADVLAFTAHNLGMAIQPHPAATE